MRLRELASRIRGFTTPYGGVTWNPLPSERDAANRLVVYLYDKRVLYEPAHAEIAEHAVHSVLEIRKELTDIAKQFSAGVDLELKIRAMRAACIHFLNRTGKRKEIVEFAGCPGHWASWEFLDALGQWRAFMSVYISMICTTYEIDPPRFLADLIPPLGHVPEPQPRREDV